MTIKRNLPARTLVVLVGLTLLILTSLAVSTAEAGGPDGFCPPQPPGSAGPAKAVPNKAGETGWLLNVEKDDAGNRVETWCLEEKKATAADPTTHGGPMVGQRFISPNGTDVWIGACVFPNGQNKINKAFDDKLDKDGEPTPNGIPDQLFALTWHNWEGPPNGTKDLHYTYNVTTNKLLVEKTEEEYVLENNEKTGEKVRVYKKSKTVDSDIYDAPSSFSDLKFKGEKLTDLGTPDSSEAETFSAHATIPLTDRWAYNLLVSDFGGSGSVADPFVGLEALVLAGDLFTIGGFGITDPFVSDIAVRPEYGGWLVDSFGETFVSYRATSDALLLPGDNITGFGFFSINPPGVVAWDLSSSNELIGSSNTVLGPVAVPEPSTAVLLAVGIGFLGHRRFCQRRPKTIAMERLLTQTSIERRLIAAPLAHRDERG